MNRLRFYKGFMFISFMVQMLYNHSIWMDTNVATCFKHNMRKTEPIDVVIYIKHCKAIYYTFSNYGSIVFGDSIYRAPSVCKGSGGKGKEMVTEYYM